MEMIPQYQDDTAAVVSGQRLCFQTCKAHACSPGRDGSIQCVGSAKSNRPSFFIQPYSTSQASFSSLPPAVCTYVLDLFS